MKEDVEKLKNKVAEMERMIEKLQCQLKTLLDTSYKTSNREIINREVQFLQKVYDKNGGVVSEINS